jgi:DNA-binding protein HU-beta
MNKGELIERLSGRLGDTKTSTKAVDAVVSEIENAVSHGEKVNITGFGVFEKRERAARTGRNPRTGEPIRVKKTTVPAFRPGTSFKELVSGNGSQGGGSRSRSQSARAQTSSYAKSGSAYAQPMRGQTHRAQAKRTQAPRAQAGRTQTRRAPS